MLTSLLGFASHQRLDSVGERAVQWRFSMRAHDGRISMVVQAGTNRGGNRLCSPSPSRSPSVPRNWRHLSSEAADQTERPRVARGIGVTVAAGRRIDCRDGAVVLTDRSEAAWLCGEDPARSPDGLPAGGTGQTTEPIEGATPLLTHPEQLGGHQIFRAAQFIQAQREAVRWWKSQEGASRS